MPIETVRVELLGLSFVIQTDEREEYIVKLITKLRSKIEAVSLGSGVSDPLKTAILAGLYLADEIERISKENSSSAPSLELGEITNRLIARIDDTLKE